MDDGRGQSELVGVVLLLVVVLLGSTLVVAWGHAALGADRDAVDAAHAEQSLTRLDARASDVAFGFDDRAVQTLDLGALATSDDGWLRVRLLDPTTGAPVANVTNATLGAVEYRDGETTVAYQGGGVWRTDGDGSAMVSPPEFHFRNGTLTLPVVGVSGDRALTDRVRVTRDGAPERAFPNASAGLSNRLRDGKVAVTVHSDYYRAWGRYFEETSDAYVWYDHGAERVTAVFLALPGWGSLRSGIIATSGAGELGLLGTGAYVDSYNSSLGPYDRTRGKNGTVEAVGNVTMSGNSTISGDVRSGDSVAVGTSAVVDGDVYWTEQFVNDGTVTGAHGPIDGVAPVEPIDGFVELSVARIRADNDNGAAGDVSGDRLDASGGSAELGAGSYYFEELGLAGTNLTLNTTDGDIAIGIRDWMALERSGGVGANVDVVGDGVVRVFVLGEDTTEVSVTGRGKQDVHLYVGKGSSVGVPDDRSAQFRLYAPQTFRGTVAGSNSAHAHFTGVVYAPAGVTGPSSVYVKQGDVYGQLLTGNLTVGQYGAVHYDLALKGIPLPRSPTVSRLEFLHVVVHRLRVADA